MDGVIPYVKARLGQKALQPETKQGISGDLDGRHRGAVSTSGEQSVLMKSIA
jgi:hypothetical protein